jgi:hypothetical protein
VGIEWTFHWHHESRKTEIFSQHFNRSRKWRRKCGKFYLLLVYPFFYFRQSVTARVSNAFGGEELAEANVSLGTKTRRSYRALFSVPLSHDLNARGEFAIFGQELDNSSFASSREKLRGLKAVVKSRMPGDLISIHELAYEAVARQVGGLAPAASIRWVCKIS